MCSCERMSKVECNILCWTNTTHAVSDACRIWHAGGPSRTLGRSTESCTFNFELSEYSPIASSSSLPEIGTSKILELCPSCSRALPARHRIAESLHRRRWHWQVEHIAAAAEDSDAILGLLTTTVDACAELMAAQTR